MMWILGYIGWAMAMFGVYLIGSKNVKGFYLNIFANVLLIIDAILFGHFSVVFAMVIFTTLNIINIVKWTRKPFIDEQYPKSGRLTLTREEIRAAVLKVKNDRRS